MKARTMIFSCLAIFFLNGCARSPIDAKKKNVFSTENTISKNQSTPLTDKDIFGNESTLAVSEEDIQAALNADKFSVPPHSAIILLQSGSRAPEAIVQQEMSRYYQVSTFSGIPDRQKNQSCNKVKNDEGEIVTRENMNYMQALRYIAAKGHQNAIVVYWDTLQVGRYDDTIKAMVWSDYRNDNLSNSVSLRYLVRFALVDVATGEWATWSPVNYEDNILKPTIEKNPVTEQQIAQLKQRTFATVIKDLVNRYQ